MFFFVLHRCLQSIYYVIFPLNVITAKCHYRNHGITAYLPSRQYYREIPPHPAVLPLSPLACHLLVPLFYSWQPSIFGCWLSGVELPVTWDYVSTVSDNLLHSTRDVSVHWIIPWHSAHLTFPIHTVYSAPSSVLNTQASLKIHDWLTDSIDWFRHSSAFILVIS